jgi:bacterioferritin-associated ferredoxin
VIACHCHGVSDRRIAAEVEAGARTVAEVTSRCGAGGDCGGCHPVLEDIVDDVAVRIARRPVAA